MKYRILSDEELKETEGGFIGGIIVLCLAGVLAATVYRLAKAQKKNIFDHGGIQLI